VVVAVVQIGDVRMSVHECLVAMAMRMTIIASTDVIGARVSVVLVVVVFVDVVDLVVCVPVFVVGSGDEDHPARGQPGRDELVGGDRIAEHDPRDGDADERRCREDELPAGGADVACTFDP